MCGLFNSNTLRSRMTLFFVVLAIIPLLISGGIVTVVNLQAQTQQAIALQQEISRRIAAQITADVTYTEKELRELARVADLNQLSAADQNQRLSQLLFDQDNLDSLVLLDAAGREQAHVDRMRFVNMKAQPDWSGVAEYTMPLTTGAVYYGSLQFDATTREPYLPLAFPLTNLRSGAVEGVLVGNIRLKAIWEIVQANSGQMTFVTDDQGRIIAHSVATVVMNGSRFDRPSLPGITSSIGGDMMLTAWEPVQLGAQTLYVIAQQPIFEALGLAIYTIGVTFVVLFIAVLAAVGVGTLAVRQIVRPLESLVAAARESDFTQTVNIRAPAEIGVLADAFNTMTTRLRETLYGLEKLNVELDQRVVTRTKELEQANARLTELDRLKTRFITDISHELRTPLTIITTSVYLLRRSPPERHPDHLDKLDRQINRLNQFVSRVFDIARLDDASHRPVFQTVSLNAIISAAIVDFASRAEVAGLELIVEPEEIPPIYGEGDQLMLVVSNLLANAIDYTPAGRVEIRTQVEGAGVSLQVRDTGRGIAPEDIPHLYERFYRGKGIGSSNIPGSGLGLSIVKQIVDMHRGSIHVESQLDRGTTFRVWLPSGA